MRSRKQIIDRSLLRLAGAILLLLGLVTATSCENQKEVEEPLVWTTGEESAEEEESESTEEPTDPAEEETGFLLPEIDLNNWKVTLPVGTNGKPTEVEPPEILTYATNETLLPYMYNDSTDGSLVFYTFPGVTTPNSSRSRTELREQMVPGSNSTNWTFKQGGRMYGKLAMEEISKDASGEFHRTIIMQIHGRLTNEQRDRIGASDNNAPPVLKIYWYKGRVRVKTKVLVDQDMTGDELLLTSSWTDDEGHNFTEEVGYDPFTLEVVASDGNLIVILNGKESVSYQGVDLDKWGVFENYFKAGNYLQTTDEGSFAKIKYYELDVTH